MNTCPCCSHKMLRHIRQKEIYWYCSCCHQEMPNISSLKTNKNLSIATNATQELLSYKSTDKTSLVIA